MRACGHILQGDELQVRRLVYSELAVWPFPAGSQVSEVDVGRSLTLYVNKQ